MIDVRGLAPLLAVFDMPTSVGFYCDVLGCKVVSMSAEAPAEAGWVLLSLNGTELMLNTAYERSERPPKPNTQRIAAHKDTTLYFGAPDVDAVYHYLVGRGISVKAPEVAWYGMKQLYVSDPDGYLLCFQWKEEDSIENRLRSNSVAV